MTTPNKLWSGMLRLNGSNMNFQDTYVWCENKNFLDPAITGNLDYAVGSSLALSFDTATPAVSKIISGGFGDGSPLLCED